MAARLLDPFRIRIDREYRCCHRRDLERQAPVPAADLEDAKSVHRRELGERRPLHTYGVDPPRHAGIFAPQSRSRCPTPQTLTRSLETWEFCAPQYQNRYRTSG